MADLRSTDARTKSRASVVLGQVYRLPHEKKRAILPALLSGTRDADHEVRGACATALGNCRGEVALSGILDLWQNGDNRVRYAAVNLLIAHHKESREALEVLIEALGSPWVGIRENASLGLGNRGWRAWKALPALRAAKKRERWSRSARWWMNDAICRIHFHFPLFSWRTFILLEGVLVLRILLIPVPCRLIRKFSIWYQRRFPSFFIGPEYGRVRIRKTSIPLLEEALKSFDPRTRENATLALSWIRGELPSLVIPLRE